MAILVDQQVVRLDIPVHYIGTVDELGCTQNIIKNGFELALLSTTGHFLRQNLSEIALNVFLDHDVIVYGIRDSSRHDVTTYFNVYANYDDFPMTTCDNSTVDGTIGHGGITGFYAHHDLYDEDDIAMKIYSSACGGQKHDYALLGYFCAYSQNFDFTAGNGIDCYNLPSATLDDAVISDSGRKDTLSIEY